MDRGRISDLQLMFLLVVTVLSTAILFAPSIGPEIAGRDAWITKVIATLTGVAIALVVANLGLRFPSETIIQYTPKILGTLPGKFVGFLYVFGFIHINTVTISESSYFMVTAFMPDTPFLIFSISVVLIAAWAVRGGIEVIARANQFVFFIFSASLLGLAVLVANEMQLDWLLPVLEKGFGPVLTGSLTPTTFRGEVFLLLMLLPFLNQPWKGYRATIWAVVLIGFFLVLEDIVVVTVFTAELPGRMVFPILQVGRIINVAEFIQRLESLVMVLWVAGIFVKVSVYYYAGVLGLAQWLGLSDYRPLVLPVGGLLTAGSVLAFANIIDLRDFLAIFPFYGLPMEFIVPLLLLIVAHLRGFRIRQK